MPSISVIIPVHGGGEAFAACLASVVDAVSPPDELIVVADGETDGAWRRALQHDARVLTNEVAHGPAHARNRGAQAATGDVLFFVDADVVIRPDTLSRVRDAFADAPDLSALIGSYDDTPGHSGFLSQYRNLLHHFTHQTSNEDAATFWGACGAVRRAVFLAVGGFDEAYRHPSIEDIEFGYRLTQAGHRIRLCKELQVTHLKPWSAGSMIKTDLFRRAVPWTELLLSRRIRQHDLNLRLEHRISGLAVFGLLGALLSAWRVPATGLLVGGLAGLLVILNAPFYRFLARKRGMGFCLRAIPWHWLYYAYSGLGFGLGLARYFYRSRIAGLVRRRPPVPFDLPVESNEI